MGNLHSCSCFQPIKLENTAPVHQLQNFGQSVGFGDLYESHNIKASSLQILDVITDCEAALKYFRDGVEPEKPYRVNLSELITPENQSEIMKEHLQYCDGRSDAGYLRAHMNHAFSYLEEARKVRTKGQKSGNYLPDPEETSFHISLVPRNDYLWSADNAHMNCLLYSPKLKINLPDGQYCLIAGITGKDNVITMFRSRVLTIKEGHLTVSL